MSVEALKDQAVTVVVEALVKNDPAEFASEEDNGGQTRATSLANDVVAALITQGLIK